MQSTNKSPASVGKRGVQIRIYLIQPILFREGFRWHGRCRQVSWLTGVATPSPSHSRRNSGLARVIPDLQWRDRSGITPASLLTLWLDKAPTGCMDSYWQSVFLNYHYSNIVGKREISFSQLNWLLFTDFVIHRTDE